jgi:hypothetical protein
VQLWLQTLRLANYQTGRCIFDHPSMSSHNPICLKFISTLNLCKCNFFANKNFLNLFHLCPKHFHQRESVGHCTCSQLVFTFFRVQFLFERLVIDFLNCWESYNHTLGYLLLWTFYTVFLLSVLHMKFFTQDSCRHWYVAELNTF